MQKKTRRFERTAASVCKEYAILTLATLVMSAGTYLFKVKATNNDGIWNEKGTSLKITIHPPFYWSTASKLLYFVLVCIAFGFVIHFIIKRTEKKHTAEINKLNANKEKEVHEAKIKFFTMIAHEIRTPVSLIIGPLPSYGPSL